MKRFKEGETVEITKGFYNFSTGTTFEFCCYCENNDCVICENYDGKFCYYIVSLDNIRKPGEFKKGDRIVVKGLENREFYFVDYDNDGDCILQNLSYGRWHAESRELSACKLYVPEPEFKILMCYNSPTGTIHAGVIKKESEWIRIFPNLDKGDCAIKTDWFEEVKN